MVPNTVSIHALSREIKQKLTYKMCILVHKHNSLLEHVSAAENHIYLHTCGSFFCYWISNTDTTWSDHLLKSLSGLLSSTS